MSGFGHNRVISGGIFEASRVLSLLGLLFVSGAWAMARGDAQQTHEGCYQARLGAWIPSPAVAQVVYLELPETIRLTHDLGTEGAELGKQVVRPAQELEGRVSWALWHQNSDDALEVVYINDFGSIHLKLVRRSWGWIGDAVATRGAASEFRASARLVEKSCA